MAGATAADYAWFQDHWLPEAFCITLVRGLDEREVLGAAIEEATPAARRQAAATAARQAVELARLDHDPVVAEALVAAEAGQALPVGDHSPLGRRIRTWAVEATVPGRPGGAGRPVRRPRTAVFGNPRAAALPARRLLGGDPGLGAGAAAASGCSGGGTVA